MKKLIQVLVVFILIVTIVGVARNNAVWAGPLSDAELTGANSPLQTRIVITGSGNYNVGGVCTLAIEFKGTSPLQVKSDAEIPLVESMKVPFYGEGELLRPGCHVVHVKEDKVVKELDGADGTAKICFGASPEMKMKMYYYQDTPFTSSPVFIEVPATLEDNGRLICASASITGVYLPPGWVEPQPNSVIQGTNLPIVEPGRGSVVPPSSTMRITKSGTYAVGGICMLKVLYKETGLSDTIHVEPPEQDTFSIPFPDNQDLFYFPGCHVVHYKDSQVKYIMTPQEGEWEVCFAARPGKTMTIYYYRYEDPEHKFVDPKLLEGPWKPLVTTTADGLACAPAVDYTAVYTPAGK